MTINDENQQPYHEQQANMGHPDKEKGHVKEIWKGIFLTLFLHVITIVISLFFPFAIFSIGVVQLLYMIPVTLYYYSKKRIGLVQGLMIGIAVTFLLNAACFGIVIVMIS